MGKIKDIMYVNNNIKTYQASKHSGLNPTKMDYKEVVKDSKDDQNKSQT